ncbi:hypothetical protein LCL95_00785 [Bacillus timonensis]|nr:hypothetical protein [Bacillus timonensis]
MDKSNILFYTFAAGFFYLYFKILGVIWNSLPITVSGISNLVVFAITFLVIVPIALISAKKLTEFFIPKGDV